MIRRINITQSNKKLKKYNKKECNCSNPYSLFLKKLNKKQSKCITSFIQKRFYSSVIEKKGTLIDIRNKYEAGVPLSLITSYDFTSGSLAEESNIDAILVGDSLGMVVLGREDTTTVTMDEVIYHCKAVRNGAKNTFIIGDMPFGSYEISDQDALSNAVRLVKEGFVNAVKLEGGEKMKSRVKAIVNAGIPVMGHIGLTPQTINALGGFLAQGKTAETAKNLVSDALALQEAGCFAIVIESVPQKIAQFITEKLTIPTIGIGAGKYTSGQILVWHDMLGSYSKMTPKFCKQYTDTKSAISSALSQYKKEVEERAFPSQEHVFTLKQEEWDKFRAMFNIPKSDSKTKSEPIPKKKTKIAIIGAGSMGSLFGARIASNSLKLDSPNDPDVWLLSSWKDHVDAINKNGLIVQELNGSTKTIKNIRATSYPEDIIAKNGPADIVIILVKSPYTKSAAEKTRILLGTKPFESDIQTIVTLQNGLGNLEIIHSELSKNAINSREPRIIQGVTSQGGMVIAPGIVKHTGNGNTAFHGNPNHTHVNLIKSLFANGGVENISIADDLESIIWGKLIINAAINPLTAILQYTNEELLKSSEAVELCTKIITEAMNVAQARGTKLPFNDPLKMTMEVLRDTAKNYSSMLRDVQRGVPTEIDFINGAIVKEGEKYGVSVEYNKRIIKILQKPQMRASILNDYLRSKNPTDYVYL
jgi:3-methyl-2-oxobutanoate hydroxymethyltransferase